MRFVAALVGLALLALTPYQFGKLPKVRVLVVYRENLKDLWDFLVKGGDYRVVDLRVGVAYLPAELQDALKGWVKSGGGVVVYAGADDESDSWSVFLKDEDVEYARLNRWVPVVLKRKKGVKHPLLVGVERIKLFLHRIPDLKATQGKTALFTTPDGKPVAFAMNYGRGRVVFLPTGPLLPYFPVDQYDNRRFFINIYQWLAGNPVPK